MDVKKVKKRRGRERKKKGEKKSYLELIKSKTTSGANTVVVLEGLSTDGGSEKVQRTRGDGGGLGNASVTAGDLLRGLVEPGLDIRLPILVEMGVGNDVVVLDHLSN